MTSKYEMTSSANKSMDSDGLEPRQAPSFDPNRRNEQMIALAYDLVESRLRDGSASSAETTHFLKMGTEMYKLQQMQVEQQTKLAMAKAKAIETEEKAAATAEEALEAYRSYSGSN